MTVDAAARLLWISRLAAEEGLNSGDLPAVDLDGVLVVDTRELLVEMGVDLTELEREANWMMCHPAAPVDRLRPSCRNRREGL